MKRATGRPARRAVVATIALAVAGVAHAAAFGGWTAAVSVEAAGADLALNTTALEGCPSVSKDGLSLYFASNRAGGYGNLDIWVARRKSVDAAWGAPENVGAPINSDVDEFCPTPLRNGHGFLYVSTRSGGCGGSDMYATRNHATRGWLRPENLGCVANSAADEASPFLVGDELYFSSTRPGGFAADAPGAAAGDFDLYVVDVGDDASVGVPTLVPNVNSAQNDARPNLRRDGLELFFDSNRPGGFGGPDLWSADRSSASDPWTAPQNLGPNVNSPAGETRPSLSWDGTTLYFGSTRSGGEGSSDLYVTTRTRN